RPPPRAPRSRPPGASGYGRARSCWRRWPGWRWSRPGRPCGPAVSLRAVGADDLSERLVDSLNAGYGVHEGHRAAHAKGVLCAATFTPSPAASALSRASHMAGPEVRAHVRFSNGSGDPTAADATRDGRGMAVKFYLSGGTTT